MKHLVTQCVNIKALVHVECQWDISVSEGRHFASHRSGDRLNIPLCVFYFINKGFLWRNSFQWALHAAHTRLMFNPFDKTITILSNCPVIQFPLLLCAFHVNLDSVSVKSLKKDCQWSKVTAHPVWGKKGVTFFFFLNSHQTLKVNYVRIIHTYTHQQLQRF